MFLLFYFLLAVHGTPPMCLIVCWTSGNLHWAQALQLMNNQATIVKLTLEAQASFTAQCVHLFSLEHYSLKETLKYSERTENTKHIYTDPCKNSLWRTARRNIFPQTSFPPLSPHSPKHNKLSREDRLQTLLSEKYAHTKGAHRSIRLRSWATLSGSSTGEPETNGCISFDDCLQGDMEQKTSRAEIQSEPARNRWEEGNLGILLLASVPQSSQYDCHPSM